MTDTNQTYKPGDVANGHRLTEQPDGTQVWLPIEAEAKPRKKSRKVLWIVLGAIAAALLFIIVVGSIASANRGASTEPVDSASDELTPGQKAEREAAEEEPVSEPEPAPAPVPEVGTLANPAPVGSVTTVTQGDGATYDLVINGVNWDANTAVAQENQFNDAAAPGFHYIWLTSTITNTTADAAKAVRPGSAAYTMTVTDQTGASYSQVSVVLPDDLGMMSEIYAGQSATGNIAFMVPDSTTTLVAGLGGVFTALQ